MFLPLFLLTSFIYSNLLALYVHHTYLALFLSQTEKKILILQTAFLGDLILSTPFFHAVRNQFPDAQIDLVCNLGTEQIVFGNPDINEVIPIDKKKSNKRLFGFLKFALALRDKKYDIIFSPHFSYRSTILSYIIGAKIRIGYKQSGFSFLHTKKID